jgi:hypothetical protein
VDGWARLIGQLSQPYLERIVDAFRTALTAYDDKRGRVGDDAAKLIGMLSYVRVCLPQSQEDQVAQRVQVERL